MPGPALVQARRFRYNERSLIVIAALMAQGDLEAQLRMHTRWTLDHGATPPELDELATLIAIYSGFARASHGLMIIRDELSKLRGAGRPSAPGSCAGH